MNWWVLTLLYNSRSWTTLYTLAWTNRDAHLFMAWANYKPARHKVYKNVRGLQVHCGYRWIWDTPNLAEQTESGHTYTHTFKLAALGPTHHIWYYLFSPAPDLTRECQGPLIHIQPLEKRMPSAKIYNAAHQPAPHNLVFPISYNSVYWDHGGFYDPAEPTRLTPPEPGLYSLGACVRLSEAPNASAWLDIRLLPADILVLHAHLLGPVGWGGATFSVATIVPLQNGDHLTTNFYHNDAADKEILYSHDYSPNFWIAYIGPYPA